MIAVARKHANVYIDTSAYTSARLPQELISFMHTRTGSNKVLFGTNYPVRPSPADPQVSSIAPALRRPHDLRPTTYVTTI